MPGNSTRRTVSPLRRITPTGPDARNPRTRRSVSSSSFTPSKSKNPDYGRFTPLASQPQATSNASSGPSELNRYYPTPSPPPLDLEPLPAPVALPKQAPLLEERMTYTSLPSTPVLGATIPEFSTTATARPESIDPHFASQNAEADQEPFSLWDYLREELLATDFDSHQELKWERVSNFLNIPIAIEKIVGFGYILCLDSFLHTFTIQPIRFVLAAYRLFVNCITFSKRALPPSQKADLLRVLIMILAMSMLVPLTDASKIYHSIRGQDNIKIYVIYNALEIADRLCTSFGQDILDCLFSRSTLLVLTYRLPLSFQTLRPFLYFGLASCYLVLHSLVLVYQLISLNVATNSYDNALLTLLISNQFVEIKGSVFKKFEKDNLFQITCADIVERFQLSLMLLVVALRNVIELSSDSFDLESSGLPHSFKVSFLSGIGGGRIWAIFSPVMTVLLSELVVDWLKHAFITKFNHIRPSVYERYTDVLCRDLLASGSGRSSRKNTYVDQSPLVARRLGLPTLPLAVLALLIGSQLSEHVLAMHEWNWTWERAIQCAVLGVLVWLCLVTIKLMLGVNLLVYATSRKKYMDARVQDDEDVNKFGRNPIGEGKDEQVYNRELKTLLSRKADDVGGGAARKKVALEDLTRFTMVKRIW
ncbi:Protein TAPT1 homolog OS=Schizosaccharomyces pombe (strain 972 / ATCC 24843) GN=SPBC13G1,05 PE=1 SV=1 [Rhizoctonia solani AG-1 IB]|uniref:Protein TAPT1 homolog n=1 Tax=Thanatephorus cucumeris (strain AG1-IB / isolate 7/3/14) TaxID=1108050 RepID=A0A0B7F7S6_THACB|nr:Protein TAPT1 homolog OS=Schizosaccharomyces pombe (strain 972 / ATCC 24843) GN=SPBC13G1,05 PE=1 SV=1 [Rhizoctonia solani AG-1 IB]